MNTILHKAATRGYTDYGWLKSYHTFSFGGYRNPERDRFGTLRVLNDDYVASGKGFDTHSHSNMEIISIPLEGDLEHKDSMGNVATIREGDIQIMSAGTGIRHSEYNKNPDRAVKFLQIWIFPNQHNIEPRYNQVSLRDIEKQNAFYQVLSPNPDDSGVWIHQEAWFHLGEFAAATSERYPLKKKGNGVYVFMLEGKAEIGEETVEKQDGLGIWDTDAVNLTFPTESRVLLMEVPMQLP